MQDPTTLIPVPPPTAARRHPRHTLALSPYYDSWIDARMAERGMTRKAVVEQLIQATIDGRGVHLSPASANEAVGHANAAALIARSMRLTVRNPDHLRGLADIETAAAAVARIVRRGSSAV